MKYIKKFENHHKFGDNGKISEGQLRSFGPDEFNEFCEYVREWENKTGNRVLWSTYGTPPTPEITPGVPSSFGWSSDKAKPYYDKYIKGGVFIIIDMGDRLIGAILKDGKISHAYYNDEEKVPVDMVQDFIDNI